MILGIGTDIVAVERVRGMLERHGEHFCVRHFTEREREWCDAGRGNARAERYAARFAAKEAVSKALGCGIGADAGFLEIEVLRDPSPQGAPPELVLSGRAKATADRKGVTRMHLSLAHEREMAVAMVVLEGD
ncbi:MAG: holo-ACP synthase [Planctomycetota bacterium]